MSSFAVARPLPQVSGNAGTPALAAKNRSAQVVTTLLTEAGTLGSIFPISQSGDNFYIVLATGPVTCKPYGGQVNDYTQGTGLYTPDAPFANLQIENKGASPIVVSIFVGFGQYIDNRLIVSDPMVSDVAIATYPVPNAATSVTIADLSNTKVTDANGNVFLALNRTAIYVTNLDTGVTYFLWSTAGSVGAIALLGVPPSQCSVFGANGNFVLAPNGAGNVNAIVSQVYTAVRPTLGL